MANQEKQHELDKIIARTESKRKSDEAAMDQAVRQALQKARRNINMLQKVANGIFKVKNKV